MIAHLPTASSPDRHAVALATRTLDGLLGPGVSRPDDWTAEEYLLKGTGRVPLSPPDRGPSAGGDFHDPNANGLHPVDGVPAQPLAHVAAPVSRGHREQVDRPVIGLPGRVPGN